MTSVPGKTETLKIIIASTPKTGNTWLKLLLSEIYDLPQVELLPRLEPGDWTALGPRWIAHQHFLPEPLLREWGREHGVIFLTTIRHPGDVLVSLRHHLQNQAVPPTAEPSQPASMLLDAPSAYGEHTWRFLEHGFYLVLHASICWWRGGWAEAVRYEDLCAQPVATLRALTNRILPVPEERLQQAVAACEITRLRERSMAGQKFFRKGTPGGWRTDLPPEMQEWLVSAEPYRTQLNLLGYPVSPAKTPEPIPERTRGPFAAGGHFANGVKIAPVLARLFAELPKSLSKQWSDPTAVGNDSFFAWLNRPAAADPSAGSAVPVVTELTHQLYRMLPELQKLYPDPFGRDRMSLSNWLLYFGIAGYALPDVAFALPVIRSYAAGRVI
ncbi:MAG: sulfotransferase domain-containing protein [Opitutaceae bacterium]|nr:sulfotransferase domain-containing protein [Opitutaceae bacterium]